jgi:integrase
MTLAQACERYLAAKSRKRSLGNDTRIVKHLKQEFGAETPLAEITAGRISEYKAGRLAAVRKIGEGEGATERRLTAAAVNRPLALLRHLLRLAHDEWEALPAVPTIRLEREPQGRVRWLEPDEEVRLLEACSKSRTKHLAGVVRVALETGLRRSELLDLTWDRVDLSRGVIRLEITKSGRRREVPMRQAVYEVLVGLQGDREGRVWPVGDIRTAFENAVVEAKLDGLHFHDLRHSLASWLVMRGGSLQALQTILGHQDIKMTLRYAHLAPDHLRSEMTRTERGAQTASQITQAITHEPATEMESLRK